MLRENILNFLKHFLNITKKILYIIKLAALSGILSFTSVSILGAATNEIEKLPSPLISSKESGAENVVRLSLQQALEMALENNLDINIESYFPQIAQQQIKVEEGYFDIEAFFNTSYSKKISEPFNYISAEVLNINDINAVQGGISQNIITGGIYRIEYYHWRYGDNSPFNLYNPYYKPVLRFQMTQPLLKGRGFEISKKRIYMAHNNHKISRQKFKQQLMETLNTVCLLYYNLVFQIENLKIKKGSLKLAQDQLEITRFQVKIGTLSPLETAQVEAGVASREADIILAEKLVKQAQDELFRALSAETDSTSWNIVIEPTDEFLFNDESHNIEECLQIAVKSRPELAQSKLMIKNKELEVNFAKNQKLPQIDLEARLSFDGLDGDKPIIEGNPFTGERNVVGVIPGGLGGALGDLFSLDYRDWSVGLNVTIPIQNRAAKGAYARSKIKLEQEKKQHQNTQQHIILEVKNALRDVQANKKMVEASKIARELSEKQLEAEQKKFAVGLSSNFKILRMQQELAVHQMREEDAIKNYKISYFTLKKVLGTLLEDFNIELKSE